MICSNGCDVNEKMMDYLRPLIQGERSVRYENGIPAHLILEENLAVKWRNNYRHKDRICMTQSLSFFAYILQKKLLDGKQI